MLSMNPNWKPFMTARTEVSTITPTATPSMETTEEARPLLPRRALKVRQAT
jgi:hypothetical protein